MLWSLNSNSFTDKNLSSLLTGEIKEWLCILSKEGLISFFSMKYWEYIFGHRGYKVQFIHWSNKHLLSPYKVPDISVQFSSVQSLSRVQLFATLWIAARQASLSISNSQSLPKLMSIKSVMPSSHLILCRPLLLLPPILPSIRVFSNESTLRMRWPEYWSFSFSISPSSEHPASK